MPRIHVLGPVHTLRPVGVLRHVAFAVVLLALAVLPGVTRASASTGRGTVVVHARACSAAEVASTASLFDACHGNPLADARFTLDGRQPKETGADGNVSFKRALAGDHQIIFSDPVLAGQATSVRVFCSNVIAGTGPVEAEIVGVEYPIFYTYLRPADRLVCDVYVFS